MEILRVSRPSTIFVTLPDYTKYFELFDIAAGKPYYFRYLDGKTPRIKFNVPDIGEYSTNVTVQVTKVTDIRTPFNLPELPYPDRNRLKDTNVYVNPNASTVACIYTDSGEIHVSQEFLSFPTQIQDFLIFHERGHLLYSKEEDCDLYALICCLRKGNNRSMCFYAMTEYLSTTAQNIQRMITMFQEIGKTQKTKL